MTKVAERIKSELATLSAKERAELAYFLLHSLDDKEDADSEAAWDAELARRESDVKSGNVVCEPVDKVMLELREKHS